MGALKAQWVEGGSDFSLYILTFVGLTRKKSSYFQMICQMEREGGVGQGAEQASFLGLLVTL